MSEMTTLPTTELANLQERVKKLANDKSYLQLIIRLMNRMSAVPGLDSTVENMLRNIVDVIGGANVILYYVVDNAIFYADVYGERRKIDGVTDSLVKQVMETREPIEYEHEFGDTRMMTPEFSKAYTWIVPLLVGSDLVGVFKMESLHIAMRELYQQLPTFFAYAALVLKNEIQGHTRLKKAYDDLAREVTVRKQAEENLRLANEVLEERVAERTAELRRANDQLRESEERYRIVADNTYDWEFWVSPGGQFLYNSPSCQRITGHLADEFAYDPGLLNRIVHPEDRERFMLHYQYVMEKKRPDEIEFRILRADGSVRYVGHVCQPVFDEQGLYQGDRGSNRDITQRKQAEEALRRLNRELRAISNCNQVLMRAVDEQTLLNDICRIVCDMAGYRMAWVGCAENDEARTVRPVAWAGIEDGYLASANITWADTERGRGPTGIAIRSGESACIQEFMTDSKAAPWRENALQRGYRSSIALPLKDESARAFGTLTIYSTEPNAFAPDEIRLLEELAGDLAFGITVLRNRTERKRAEEALHESETKFRAVFESSVDAIGVSKAGIHTFVNPAYLALFGYADNAELTGKPILDLIAPGRREQILENVRRRASGQTAPLVYETRGLRKDGSEFDMDVHMSTYELNGEIYSVPILRDITERKRADAALKRSESFSRSIIENEPECVKIVGAEGILKYMNPAGLAMIEVEDLAVVAGHSVYPIVVPEYREAFSDLTKKVLRGERGNLQFEIVGLKGTRRWLDTHAVPLVDDQGNVEALLGLTRDITERKRAEEEIARALQAEKKAREVAEILREANESLSRTLNLDDVLHNLLQYLSRLVPYDSANVMLLEGDFQLRVAALHSYERWVDPDMTRKIAFDIRTSPILNELVATQKSALIADTREQPGWIRPAGAEHVISWLGVPIVADRQVIGLYSVDKVEPGFFTEEHRRLAEGLAGQAAVAIQNTRLHNQIKHANAELEQRVVDRTAQLETANKELEAFAYSVSHDLRAPLRHIDGFLELLHKRAATTLDEQSQHYLATISDAAKRMGTLIDDLLSFSRMGRYEMSGMQVDLDELVQEITRELEPETRGRDIHWRIADLPVVTGDRALLRLVLVNLISNALKFTRPRQPAEIEISRAPGEETETVVYVRDNGVGFDMDYADKLFGVFQRLHRADEFEGTGIGLANVRRIIHRHGGRTWAQGEIDHGATFYFSLPHSTQGV